MRKLEFKGFPRLQMFLLVMLTGAVGMVSSYFLLRTGFEAMSVRYPMAVGVSYVSFLFLLWLWLRSKAEDYMDIPDFSGSGASHSSGCTTVHGNDFGGGGGGTGGGGASGGFQFDDPLPSPSLPSLNASGDSVGEVVGNVIGSADEGAIPLVVVLLLAALAATLFLASLYIVYLAPALFAELLVDGVLSASLYRRLKGLKTRHWLESAVRRTILPFVITAITLSVLGYAFQAYAPETHTLGEVLQHYRASP